MPSHICTGSWKLACLKEDSVKGLLFINTHESQRQWIYPHSALLILLSICVREEESASILAAVRSDPCSIWQRQAIFRWRRLNRDRKTVPGERKKNHEGSLAVESEVPQRGNGLMATYLKSMAIPRILGPCFIQSVKQVGEKAKRSLKVHLA